MSRGAFIVLEGCDKVGKSTVVQLLVEALNKLGYPTEARRFPNRDTRNGRLIDQYLTSKVDLPCETVHSLFSANRWDCFDNILETLHSGKTIIVDRYAASGAAYGAVNTGKSLDWCKQPDKGLPAPDLVLLLRIDKETQARRTGWGEERFENKEFQWKVAENFLKLADHTWKIIDNDELKETRDKVLEAALKTIEAVEHTPIKTLYES